MPRHRRPIGRPQRPQAVGRPRQPGSPGPQVRRKIPKFRGYQPRNQPRNLAGRRSPGLPLSLEAPEPQPEDFRAGARDFGRRGASPLSGLRRAVPGSLELATILLLAANLADDSLRRKIERAPSGKRRSRGGFWRACGEREAGESTAASRSAPMIVVASPLALHHRLRAVRHAPMLRCKSQLHRSSSQLQLGICGSCAVIIIITRSLTILAQKVTAAPWASK